MPEETNDTVQEPESTDAVVLPTVSDEDVQRLFAESLNPRVQAQLKDGILSPMLLAELLNVRPQMIYQYIGKGKITAVQLNNTQKKVVRIAEARRFAREYLSRKQQRDFDATVKAAQVQAQLRGEVSA